MVVQLLLEHGALRYSEIRDRVPDVTEKMLTVVLADLTADGLIYREEHKSKAPKIVFYALSDLGRKSKDLISQMVWFGSHFNV
ncbi:MAG: winged helix-turn-helix transcriptional regulator [Bacteroidota bacterium]